MTTAEELLNNAAASGTTPADTKSYFTIDLHSRIITPPFNVKNIGVESDDEVTRLYFRIPRYYDEVDLSEFETRINYTNANGEDDMYGVEDVTVDGDYLVFSWLVGRFAVTKKGTVKFIVCMIQIDENGVIDREFNTTTCTMPVLEGLETVPFEDKEDVKDAVHLVAKEAAKQALDDNDYITLADTVSVYEFGDYEHFYIGVIGGYVDMSLLPIGKRVRLKYTNIPLLYVSGQPISGYGELPETEQEFIEMLNETGEVSYYGIALRDYAKDSGMVSGGGGGGGGPATNVPKKVSELENDAGYLTADEVPITSTEDSVTLNGKDFLDIESADSMGFKTRNAMYFESENDMSLRATNINVAGDMTVQDPVGNSSVVNKKYVDDGIDDAVGDVEKAVDEIMDMQESILNGEDDGTTAAAINAHNTSNTSHGDIREAIGNIDKAADEILNIRESILNGDDDGTTAAAINAHNTSNASHSDIRQLINSLNTRVDAIEDSIETALDNIIALQNAKIEG